ncbi:MAG: YicC family protein [Nitrospirae bacterium]|nr:YicC family protein [Nitrospirota bacterium]
MVQSMTGFGSAEKNGFRVEIRSLNHRFIDISTKVPSYMSQHDIPLRKILKERFHRGRFDVSVSITGHELTQLSINKELARKIYTAFQDLQKELSIPGQIYIDTLANYRELIIEEEPEYDVDALYTAFTEAVSKLEAMRMQEGEMLSKELRNSAESLNVLNNKIKSLCPDMLTCYREKLSERLKTILGGIEPDNVRIMQEAAIMAERLDISEEVSRIENHIKQFIEILNDGNVIGRRLDFLLQEINREVNTIASKSSDYTILSLTVEMKIEIEKMREQVQNIQ